MEKYWIILILVALGCSESKEGKLQKFLAKGNIEGKNKNYDQGISYYQEAIRIDPCFTEGLNNLGTAYYKQDKYSQALKYYQDAIQCDPDFMPAFYNRANAYYALKEYFNALNDLDRIQAARPDTAIVYFTRGLVQTKLRNFDLAKAAFGKAYGLDSTNVEFLVNLAN
ncbi:MAG TPA: tetratricopeptide repeat protein, partial [Cyclobacteriaceae bacterium]|nr:tetratricopeptide repeat protein [Cyclobacteriaceae bacterium]